MTPFKKPVHSTLSNELVAALTRAALASTSSLDSDPTIKKIRATFTDPLEELDRALIRDSKNPYTMQLNELDFERDQLIVASRSHCIAAIDQYMVNKIKADQARVVYELVKKLSPNVTRLGYQEESTEVHALLKGAEQIAGAVEESGVEPLFTLLKAAQKKFDALYVTKVQTDTKGSEPRRIKSIRKDLTDSLTDLFSQIATGAKYNPAQYESVIVALNALADEFAAKAAAAATRKENAQPV